MKKKLCFYLFLFGLIFLSKESFADQCAVVSEAEALRALKWLKKGTAIYSFCAPCKDAYSAKVIIESIQVSKWETKFDTIRTSKNLVQVEVNGEGIDLA